MLRNIFGELMKFFLKVLNLFKIQTKFKLDSFPGSFSKFIWNLNISPKEKLFLLRYLPPCQIWKFVELWKYHFQILQVRFGLNICKIR
jgi:hypothetical protein